MIRKLFSSVSNNVKKLFGRDSDRAEKRTAQQKAEAREIAAESLLRRMSRYGGSKSRQKKPHGAPGTKRRNIFGFSACKRDRGLRRVDRRDVALSCYKIQKAESQARVRRAFFRMAKAGEKYRAMVNELAEELRRKNLSAPDCGNE